MVFVALGVSVLMQTSPSLIISGTKIEGDRIRRIAFAGGWKMEFSNLPASSIVTVQALRGLKKWGPDASGNYVQVPANIRAWAIYKTDRNGKLNLESAKPISGSFKKPGSVGLLWSGHPSGSRVIPKELPPCGAAPKDESDVKFVVDGDSGVHAEYTTGFGWSSEIVRVPVNVAGVNGCFAYPKGASGLPVLIQLHGSEGGSASAAESGAYMFASQGFPTLSLNYFAWPQSGLTGVPTTNLNTPIETLSVARAWLQTRNEVDVERVGLYGVSKGAEFSLVGATRYPWIKSVVAVVPTDVVWEGYPTPPRTGQESTWSFDGKPLPYIPLFDIDPKKFYNNTERYELSRVANPVLAEAAVIPIEKSDAKFLLLGGDRDEVWASGKMTRSLVKRLKQFGKGRNVQGVTYPLAGHMISGDGSFPVRLYGVQSSNPKDKVLDAEGEATVDGFQRAISFFRRTLFTKN
jgi:pimeloyl-ACP methyl ester carboxylesterase